VTLAALGRASEAIPLLRDAIESVRLTDNPFALGAILVLAGVADLMIGNLEDARTKAEEGVARLAEVADTMFAAYGHATIFIADYLAGDSAGAIVRLRENGGDPDMSPLFGWWRCYFLEYLTQAQLLRGHHAEAARIAHLALDEARRLDLPVAVGLARRGQAAVLLSQDDAAGSIESAAISVRLLENSGLQIEAERARILESEGLGAAGRRAEAVSAARLAFDRLDSAGVAVHRDRARDLLRRLDAASAPRRRASSEVGLAALTDREREVADLVADHRTNREIAQHLFLSPKTVETHLRNIFAKTRLDSRREVARAVERERGAPKS
jgi:DNA-binding CsgD family transcriptional regulator